MGMETKINSVIFNDCFDEMETFEDKSVDLILCDLPYGVTQNKKDVILPFDKLWEQYNRIIKDSGTIVLFGQGLFYIDLVNSNREMFRYDIVWNKELVSGFLNAKRQPLRSHEMIAIFQKKPSLCTYNPQKKKGQPLHGQGTKVFEDGAKNSNYGKFKVVKNEGGDMKYPKSIWTFRKNHPSVALHRTEKPVSLLRELILTYSNEGDLVLDNCCGSGGVAVAAMMTNRNFILIDKDEECINTTDMRIKEYLRTVKDEEHTYTREKK